MKEKLKTAANNNILKGGALLIAAQAMKKDIESEEEEEDENPFEVESDEGKVYTINYGCINKQWIVRHRKFESDTPLDSAQST